MLWVPQLWGHGTLNLEASVGVAKEVHWGGLQFAFSG